MKKLSMEELNRLKVDEFKEAPKNNFCFVLDDIRSMSNVGSIFRTSDAFLAHKIFLCGITATPPHREIEKTALGSTQTVAWEYAPEVLPLVHQLKEQGWQVVVIEQVENSVKLQNFAPQKNQKYAFVLGNEVFGVKAEIVNMAQHVVEIPQFGTKHSLNVSVTGGIVIWDYISKILSQ
jgi:23S rRNA (guanosine2251-2'-O)-methyltransferase